jgi:hypothetical protein
MGKLEYDILKQNVKTNDFLRTQSLVKDSDYSTGKWAKDVFQYRLNDEYDKIDVQNELVRNYHNKGISKDAKLYRPAKKTDIKKIKKSHLI